MYYSYRTPFSVGVNTSLFNNVYARQEHSMWCWAACLEMVMRHNGINISQDEFAKHACGVNWQGVPNNCPASFDVITKHLNTVWHDTVAEYGLSAPVQYGAPDLFRVYEELNSGNPVIVTYQNQNAVIGHAVLITGMQGYFLGDSMYITKFIVRDPSPSVESYFTRGRLVKTSTTDFMKRITAHWFPTLIEHYIQEPLWVNF